VLSLLRGMHGGKVKDARFHHRMRGEGARYEVIAQLFDRVAKRLGFAGRDRTRDARPSPFRRPHHQQSLFGE
jgi:hypothetical protein